MGSQVIARKASAQSSRQMFQHIAWHYKREVQVTVCSRQTGLPDEVQVPQIRTGPTGAYVAIRPEATSKHDG